jgi:hypothetical protein
VCTRVSSSSGQVVVPSPPAPAPYMPLPDPSPAHWTGVVAADGLEAEGRKWYMSGVGSNCKDTCAAKGLKYSWAAPPAGTLITPRLLGHEPKVKQGPWAFVECYLPEEDRLIASSLDAWGVPNKTQSSDVAKAATWSHAGCQLACPCATVTASSNATCRWEQPPACAPEFEWKGVLYSGCPTVDHHGPWCQHHHHHTNREAGEDVAWSDCIHTCDADDKPVTTSNCEWQPASSCVKEFDYEGALFVGCTSADYHSPWCSNSPLYTGSWNHCQYQCGNPSKEDLKMIKELNQWAKSESENELCSWQPPAECVEKFSYKGTEYEGCAVWLEEPTPWCSHDSVYKGASSSCKRVCRIAEPYGAP